MCLVTRVLLKDRFGFCGRTSCGHAYCPGSPGLDLSRFPYFVLRHELSLGVETMHEVFKVTTWSLNVPFSDLISGSRFFFH